MGATCDPSTNSLHFSHNRCIVPKLQISSSTGHTEEGETEGESEEGTCDEETPATLRILSGAPDDEVKSKRGDKLSLRTGDRVIFHGLRNYAHMNDASGRLVDFLEDEGCWRVEYARLHHVRAKNLVLEGSEMGSAACWEE